MTALLRGGLLPLIALLPALSGAQRLHADTPADLEETIVTARPIIDASRLDRLGGHITTVSATQLRDLGALDLTAGLRRAPGVQISRYNEVGSYSGDQGGNVYVRGLGASRPGSEIKTYVDGLPVTMGVWNHPLIDSMPLNGMASVDVHKGPQPQAYSNNFAAIDLKSRRRLDEGHSLEGLLSAGSFSTRILQAQSLGRQGRLDYLLAAGRIESEGHRANGDARLANGMGRIGVALDANWRLDAGFLHIDNSVGDPGDARFPKSTTGVGPYSFSNGVARNDSRMSRLSGGIAHEHASARGSLQLYRLEGDNDLAKDANWGTFDSHYAATGLRFQEELQAWQGGSVSLGIDHESVDGRIAGPHVGAAVGTPFGFGQAGVANVPAFRLSSYALAVAHDLPLDGGWTLTPTAGLRRHHSNHYQDHTATQLGVSLKRQGLTLQAYHSDGLLYPGAETWTLPRAIPMAFAADNGWERLSPTRDQHSELGLTWQPDARLQLAMAAFEDRIHDRYVWTGFYAGAIANPASGQWSNSFPDYRIRGLEASLAWRLWEDWSAFTGLTRLDSTLDNLPYAPKTAWTAALSGRIGALRVEVDAQRQGGMYSLTQDRGSFMPNAVAGFTVANLRLAHPLPRLGRTGELFAQFNNLLDADYQYNAGYRMPGRNIRLGLSASLGD
jgi:outer membrane cobalamin receptor